MKAEAEAAALISKAAEELEFAKYFDIITVNDDLEIAKKEVLEVVSKFIET